MIKINNRLLIYTTLGIFLLLFGLVPIVWWNDFQYLAFTGLLVLLSCYYVVFDKESKFYIDKSDILWIPFIVLCFASYVWARDGALIWNEAFNWLSSLIFIVLIRPLFSLKGFSQKIHRFLEVLFYVVLMQSLIAIFLKMDVVTWCKYLLENPNHTASYLVCLLPFALSSSFKVKPQFKIVRSIVLAVSVFLICWHKGTSGALLALFLFLFCLLLYKYKTAFIKARFGIASALVILALVQQRGILISIQSISELISAKFSDGRFFSIMTSWWVFLENPLLGVGFNNWFIENYKYDLSYVNPLNLPHTFFRFSSHNYYMDILVELGIVGLISLLVPICYILYNYITNRSKYNALGKSFFASICLFLLLINYYSIILNNDYHFSAIQLLWLLGLAYISNNRNGTRYTMSFLKKILLGLSMLSFLWYVYSGYTDYKYAQYKDEWLKYLNMDSDKAMRILDEIYHPVFHSHHRYDGPILAKKADLYFQKGEYETSLKLYEEYIAINPYDGSSLLRLAIIYKDYKEDLTKAKYYALKIYEIQNTNCRLNMLLMDIAIDEKNKAVAERHLDSFIHGTQMPYGKSYRYYIDTYKEKILLLN